MFQFSNCFHWVAAPGSKLTQYSSEFERLLNIRTIRQRAVVGLLFGGVVSSSPNWDKPLYPLAREHLACVDVAFGVHGDHVQPEKLAPVFAHAAHLAHHLAVLAVEEPDVV